MNLKQLVEVKKQLFHDIEEAYDNKDKETVIKVARAAANVEKELALYEIGEENPEAAALLMISQFSFHMQAEDIREAKNVLVSINHITSIPGLRVWTKRKLEEVAEMYPEENDQQLIKSMWQDSLNETDSQEE